MELGRISDSRGSFLKLFDCHKFNDLGIDLTVKQINQSVTESAGAVRGMHFQIPPVQEYKIVNCLKGEVYDVVVDLRLNSPTFKLWQGLYLRESEDLSVIIPPGCAHGFQAIKSNSTLMYMHSAEYSPEFERGINVADRNISINWPLPIEVLSERDRGLPNINSLDVYGCGTRNNEL